MMEFAPAFLSFSRLGQDASAGRYPSKLTVNKRHYTGTSSFAEISFVAANCFDAA